MAGERKKCEKALQAEENRENKCQTKPNSSKNKSLAGDRL